MATTENMLETAKPSTIDSSGFTQSQRRRIQSRTAATEATDVLRRGLKRGEGLKFPTQQVAGLTETEKQGQTILGQISRGEAFRDPTTSPFFSSLRREFGDIESRAVSGLRQRQNLAGGLRGSRGAREEGDVRASVGNKLGIELGRLFETESARDNPFTRLAAIQQFGGLPRFIEDARNQADFNQETGQIGFDFNTLPNIAQLLLGNQIFQTPQASGPSSSAKAATIAGGAGSVIGGLALAGL